MHHTNLWAPWRMSYLRDLMRRKEAMEVDLLARDAPAAPDASRSFLLDYWMHPEQDEASHIVHRNEHGIILLNRYPYANGHLLVALGEARPRLLDYTPEQRSEFWKLVDHAAWMMEQALNPQGINLGVNQGEAAGAGVPGHLHAHLVPRWHGDTNFMATIGEVRVIPDSLTEMATAYRDGR